MVTGGVAEQVGVLAQHAHAHSMEVHTHMPRAPLGMSAARRSRISAAALLVNVMARTCQRNTQVAEHMCDAEGQDAGLARAGAGEHQTGSGGQDRLALGGIKAVDVDERFGGLGRRRGSVVDVERNSSSGSGAAGAA